MEQHPPPGQEVPVTIPRAIELIDPQGRHLDFFDDAPPGIPAPRRRAPTRRVRLAVGLFLATCVSTFLLGAQTGSIAPHAIFKALLTAPRDIPNLLWNGLVYSTAVMATLLAHEMGHYLQTRRYGIPATLPYFIPFPISPFGTMGAVILQDGTRADRRMLFDVAISGPLAGLLLALPITYFGVVQSQIIPSRPAGLVGPVTVYGNPLLLDWIVALVHRPMQPGEDIALNPLLFAGWVGIFITALNLIPIGQLDGGHVLYTLIGRRAHAVAIGLMLLAVGYMIATQYPAYALMLGLLLLMGPRHPPTADDRVPLGWGRILLGWLTLAFIIVGFTPMPIQTM